MRQATTGNGIRQGLEPVTFAGQPKGGRPNDRGPVWCAFFRVSPLLTLLFAALIASASPVRDPKRTVNEQTVDLTPLFHWWNNHEGERPLKAWVHITGHVVTATAWGWTLNAHAEHFGEKKDSGEKEIKIMLKNPPVQEQAQFAQLKAQIETLNEERARFSTQAATAAGHAKDYSHQRHGYAVGAAYHHQETAAKEQIKHIDEQLKAINAKLAAFPDRDKYAVDCFALHTGQYVNGLPIYDHDVVFR